MIDVRRISKNNFIVAVREGEVETSHHVTLDDNYYNKLAAGVLTKAELIVRAFEFLLERESQAAIMTKFNMKILKKYFPKFEEQVGCIVNPLEDIARSA